MGGGGSKTEGISGSYHHTKVISKSPMVKQSATFNIVCNKHEKKEGEEYGEGGINQKTGTFTYSYVYEQVREGNKTKYAGGGTWECDVQQPGGEIILTWDPEKTETKRGLTEQGERVKGKCDSLKIESKGVLSSPLGKFSR